MVSPTSKFEAVTRKEIDEKLQAAAWTFQDKSKINHYETLGVAVRKRPDSYMDRHEKLMFDDESAGKFVAVIG